MSEHGRQRGTPPSCPHTSHPSPGRGRQMWTPLSHPPSHGGCRGALASGPGHAIDLQRPRPWAEIPALPELVSLSVQWRWSQSAPPGITATITFCSLIINRLLIPSSRHPVPSFAWGQSPLRPLRSSEHIPVSPVAGPGCLPLTMSHLRPSSLSCSPSWALMPWNGPSSTQPPD